MEDKKIELLNRLIKEGSIDLSEALMLLETEKVEPNVFPIYPTLTYPSNPYAPMTDWQWRPEHSPTYITCTTN